MSFVLQRSDTEIKRTTIKVSVPNNDIARLMYYFDCVCTAIDCNGDKDIQRLRDYTHWSQLQPNDQKILLGHCRTFSPNLLNNKVFFQKDELCVNFINEFYEIKKVNHLLMGSDSILIAGQVHRVNKFMVYKLQWLKYYYTDPIKRLDERLNFKAIIHKQPAPSYPANRNTLTTSSVHTQPVQVKSKKFSKWYICVFIACGLIILVTIIAGVVSSLTRK